MTDTTDEEDVIIPCPWCGNVIKRDYDDEHCCECYGKLDGTV